MRDDERNCGSVGRRFTLNSDWEIRVPFARQRVVDIRLQSFTKTCTRNHVSSLKITENKIYAELVREMPGILEHAAPPYFSSPQVHITSQH
ncbi:hypothetical protein Nepgr_000383 [Nepenthes gracilis]|uniref:Uncharacterized protein n=1 Tax=Nepenthes gracilis TaxID=150966 RepID=A0AAD3P2X1_NEPGR|nr:hypothetical protein Nepgr_000383 [Nepenthes gracilis]